MLRGVPGGRMVRHANSLGVGPCSRRRSVHDGITCSVRAPSGGSTQGESRSIATTGGAVDWEQKQEPAEYYRAAAARARALERDATTPRVKRHLRDLIDRYDRLAGEVERTAESEAGATAIRFR